jgi:hypothetical protein
MHISRRETPAVFMLTSCSRERSSARGSRDLTRSSVIWDIGPPNLCAGGRKQKNRTLPDQGNCSSATLWLIFKRNYTFGASCRQLFLGLFFHSEKHQSRAAKNCCLFNSSFVLLFKVPSIPRGQAYEREKQCASFYSPLF